MTQRGMTRVLDDAAVVVCCGSGGVGKTTSAAAIALHAALIGRRAVVVTIDPAKRLADALGLEHGLTNDPARVDLSELRIEAGADGDGSAAVAGELWATMLDTRATFDELVRQEAGSTEQAQQILANTFYRNIAGSLSGTEEYMAAEKLYQLHADPRFDLVVVDTPPSRQALDFIDAPERLARFIDHRLFRWLMVPARGGMKVLSIAAQPVLRTIGRVVGGDVLTDAIAFFQAFDGMQDGFRQRAKAVTALLRDPATRVVVITTARRETVEEARYLTDRLVDQGLQPAGLVVNRAQRRFGQITAAEATASAEAAEDPAVQALWSNLAELNGLAEREAAEVAELMGSAPFTVNVPQQPTDVHSLPGIAVIADDLFTAKVAGPAVG